MRRSTPSTKQPYTAHIDAFNKDANLTGATTDSTTGLLTITSAQYANLETLWFNIGGTARPMRRFGRVRSTLLAWAVNLTRYTSSWVTMGIKQALVSVSSTDTASCASSNVLMNVD